MKAEIEINDYLSEKEKKDIAIEVFKDGIEQTLFKGYTGVVASAECERIIGNIAYDTIYPMIDKYIPNFEEMIKNKVLDFISRDDIWHSVLRRKDVWEQTESPAVSIIDKCVKDNKTLIESKVLEAINNLSIDKQISEMVRETFDELADRFKELSLLIKTKEEE